MVDTAWHKYSEVKPPEDTEVLTYCSTYAIRELIFSDNIDDYIDSIYWQHVGYPKGFEE